MATAAAAAGTAEGEIAIADVAALLEKIMEAGNGTLAAGPVGAKEAGLTSDRFLLVPKGYAERLTGKGQITSEDVDWEYVVNVAALNVTAFIAATCGEQAAVDLAVAAGLAAAAGAMSDEYTETTNPPTGPALKMVKSRLSKESLSRSVGLVWVKVHNRFAVGHSWAHQMKATKKMKEMFFPADDQARTATDAAIYQALHPIDERPLFEWAKFGTAGERKMVNAKHAERGMPAVKLDGFLALRASALPDGTHALGLAAVITADAMKQKMAGMKTVVSAIEALKKEVIKVRTAPLSHCSAASWWGLNKQEIDIQQFEELLSFGASMYKVTKCNSTMAANPRLAKMPASADEAAITAVFEQRAAQMTVQMPAETVTLATAEDLMNEIAAIAKISKKCGE